MCFSGPSIPSTPAPPVATPSDPTVVAALNAERLRQAQSTGRQSTILTGGAPGSGTGVGLNTPQSNTPKTLLGQ